MSKRNFAVILVIIVVASIIGVLIWQYTASAPFKIHVITRPAIPPGKENNVISIARQRCVFLVVVEDEKGWLQGGVGIGEAVSISATESSGKADVTVYPQLVIPGQIVEITVIPDISSVNETLMVTITGERQGLIQTKAAGIDVIQGEDDISQYASEMREMFVPWLVVNHPELGITNNTQWAGTIVNPRILVVMHYIFYSDDWEMYITWHVTMSPHDWTRIYLRRRFTVVRPSLAFEISSVSEHPPPHAIEVPDWV